MPLRGGADRFQFQPVTRKARTEPAGLVGLDCIANGDTVFLSLDTFLATSKHFMRTP